MTNLQVLITLNGINMTLAFLIKNLFTVVFCKILHFTAFTEYCSFMTRSLNNFTGIQSLNPTNVTATFLITAAIKVVFLKTVQLVTVDVT